MKPDVNDELMFKFGFVRDKLDNPNFNVCGNISYWINKHSIRIITNKDEKLSEEQIIDKIIVNTKFNMKHNMLQLIQSYHIHSE